MDDCWDILGNYLFRDSRLVTSGQSLSMVNDMGSVGSISGNDYPLSYSTRSCQTCNGISFKKNATSVGFGKEKSLPSHHSEQEEAHKQFQFQWPKFWEWPPACTTEWDACSSVPSDTDIDPSPKALCVTLETPIPKKQKFEASKDFFANPPFIIFKRHESGYWDEFAWIRIQNRGVIARRLNLVPPRNKAFTVVWAATLKENTTVPPGLHRHILVQFTPRSDEEITDELIVRVEGDGAVVIPVSTLLQDPPLLEIDDFSLGCCFVGDKVVRTFRIKNDGGIGRFWVLDESEFMNERFGVPPAAEEPNPPVCIQVSNVEIGGEEEIEHVLESVKILPNSADEIISDKDNEETAVDDEGEAAVEPEKLNTGFGCGGGDAVGEDEIEEGNPPPNTPAETKKIFNPGQLHIPPFRLSPACFSLKGGQEIKIKVGFTPLEAKFFHERICFLCDNGEVRWVILKGLGIEAKRQKVFTIHGDGWTSDGPVMTLDLGDMSSDEPLKQNLKITNSSCTPVYYRWIHHSEVPKSLSAVEMYDQSKLQDQQKTSFLQVESEGEFAEEEVELIPGIPLTISPEEGFLQGCGEVNCVLDISCPNQLGTFSSRLCLHISQFSQATLSALQKMSDREIQHEIRRQLKLISAPPKENPFSLSTYIEPPSIEIPPQTTAAITELNIWLRSVPLQCFFEPHILRCSGPAFTQAKRRLKFYNCTKYPVNLSLGGFDSETVHIKVYPEIVNVPPQGEACLKITLRFQQPGEIQRELTGPLQLPYKTVNVFFQALVTTEPPILCQEIEKLEVQLQNAVHFDTIAELQELSEIPLLVEHEGETIGIGEELGENTGEELGENTGEELGENTGEELGENAGEEAPSTSATLINTIEN